MSKMRMMRIFALALLTMFSMGVGATVNVEIGTFTGGTVTATQGAEKDGKVTVTLTVTPASGYTITKKDITVVATFAPSSSRSNARGKAPEISSTLDLIGDDPKDLTKSRDYTVTVDANLGVWVKEAKFQEKRNDTKAGTGSESDDLSGTYYIASDAIVNKKNIYEANNPAINYYLCPTEGWCYYKPTDDFSSDGNTYPNPFLTTFKCKSDSYDDATKAEWVVKKHPTEDYYYIIHRIDGKYLMFSGKIRTTADANRIRVHLESTDSPDDSKALFAITPYKTYLVISPITEPEKWLVVNGGNTDYLTGQPGKGGGPTGYTNTMGIVGIYNVIGNETAPFYFEDIISVPVITQQNDNTFIITYPGTENVSLYYTIDGSTPDPDHVGGEYPTKQYNNTPISYQEGISVIKAVAVKAKSEGEALDTYSRITSYNVIVQLGETHPYLVQSEEEQSQPEVKYYLIPCKENDATDVVNKMSTTTLGQPSMMWYFKNAGMNAGVQYYYGQQVYRAVCIL